VEQIRAFRWVFLQLVVVAKLVGGTVPVAAEQVSMV